MLHQTSSLSPSNVDDYLSLVQSIADYVQGSSDLTPRLVVIADYPFRSMISEIETVCKIPYRDIPGFASFPDEELGESLIVGRLQSHPVYILIKKPALKGSKLPAGVAMLVRAMALLRVNTMVCLATSQSVTEELATGDIGLLVDHVNMTGANPLIGFNVDTWGPRFPDMTEPYDIALRTQALNAASTMDVPLFPAVYAGIHESSQERGKDSGFFKNIGVDCVGNSLVHEVILARHMNVRVLAFSVIQHTYGHSPVGGVGEKAAEKLKGASLHIGRLLEVIDF